MPIFEEELLEPLARKIRFHHGLKHIPLEIPLTLVDLGCGPKIRFYYEALNFGVKFRQYIGIDPLAAGELLHLHKASVVKIVNDPLKKHIPLKEKSVDIVTAFAFFEHINYPQEILAEAYRILKPGGKIILTVPSPWAKSFLEFVSYKLKLISRREIEEHKRYFDHYKLMKLLPTKVKRLQTHHEYFEWGMNNLFVIEK
ncbi:MAG: hypothetical protein UY13_C0002G0319 [Candidatus Pacebacteria bacterium GW2011_GWB1_47_8]|nr:MAG: hypothetical protein UX28_C0001G0467 [Candidatus Pacebacteria bacterium GW2011_GWA1_46_10]KKU84407.1 MAG: hypothetical protein UY13_C0002G0319 [Candidatus Pacebacteria bacterium GW2011_GWB1_47_8]HCR81164.1 hypothetical protein [Candidatus Paceibacterota bacterium]